MTMPMAQLSSVAKPCWSPWSTYGTCTVTCGTTGVRTRTRQCLCKNCDGVGKDTQPCNRVPCRPMHDPAQWTEWSQWGACPRTCGQDGNRQRTRSCSGGAPLICPGESSQLSPCNRVSCPPVGVWGPWSGYTPCSVTCGRGTRTRTRKCMGVGCVGQSMTTDNCVQPPCGNTWSDWSCTHCSRPCNGGYQTCMRQCQGPAPVRPGACIGYSYGTRRCNTLPCKSGTSSMIAATGMTGGADMVNGDVVPGTRVSPDGQSLISAAPGM